MKHTKNIIIPNGPVLIVLVGPSGAGKSTFVENHFEEREIVSSDALRTWLTGQFERQDKNSQVFEEFHRRIEARLLGGQRVVADATHLRDGDRKRTANIGFRLGVPVFYVVINRSLDDKRQTGGWRNDIRIKGKSLIEAHEETFSSNEHKIVAGDHLPWVTVIDTRDETLNIEVARPLTRDKNIALVDLLEDGYKKIRAVGDVHGNLSGLQSIVASTPDDTFLLFLGDITDYGQHSWECVHIINDLVSRGQAAMVRGNHDRKMGRYIEQTMRGEKFTGQLAFGMDISTNQLKAMEPKRATKYQMEFMSLVEQSPDWIELGDWMFAHAAIDPKMFGNSLFRSPRNSRLESMSLYGESDGTTNDRGFPNRTYGWVETMPDRKNAVLGHQIMSVVAPVERRTPTGGRVVFLDTGSSKSVDDVAGFLSYWDMTIVHGKGKSSMNLSPSEDFGRGS